MSTSVLLLPSIHRARQLLYSSKALGIRGIPVSFYLSNQLETQTKGENKGCRKKYKQKRAALYTRSLPSGEGPMEEEKWKRKGINK